jgi:protoporphyrinogen oxidase
MSERNVNVTRPHIAVLGGGAAGVTAARHLAKSSAARVDLIEIAPELGGLHKGVIIEGKAYDIGAFAFPETHELLKTFAELAGQFVAVNAKYRRITPAGSVDIYPASIEGYVRDYGLLNAARALVDLYVSKVRYRKRDSVMAYSCFLMGRRLYESTGLKHYIERLYALPDTDIGLEFALQRLRHLDQFTVAKALRSLLQRAVGGNGNDEALQHLVRPPGGFAQFYGDVRELLERDGVEVHAPARLESVSNLGGGAVEMRTDRFTRRYDAVIATIPLAGLLSLLGLEAKARYEHVTLVTLFYRGRVTAEAEFIYNFTFSGLWKRITVVSRLYGEKEQRERFSVEIAVPEKTQLDINALRNDFEVHGRKFGIFSELELMGHYVTPRAYPVFRQGQSAAVARDRALIESLGIRLAGRQGKFEYLTSVEATTQARGAAEKVLTDRKLNRAAK